MISQYEAIIKKTSEFVHPSSIDVIATHISIFIVLAFVIGKYGHSTKAAYALFYSNLSQIMSDLRLAKYLIT